MILDAVVGDNFRAEHFFQLGTLVGQVQARGDEDEHVAPWLAPVLPVCAAAAVRSGDWAPAG